VFSILLIISVVFIGCINLDDGKAEATKKKEEALKYLENLYNKEFVIKKVRYIEMNEVWEMTAAPKDNKDLEFFVKTGGKYGKNFVSDYAKIRLTLSSRKYYESILKKIFGRKIYFYSNTGTYTKFKNNKIPTFKELLKYGSEKTYVNMFIYIFEDVVSEKKRQEKFLSNVMELLKYLRNQDLKWATVEVKMFDEKFFKGKDIDFILEETNYFHKGSTKLKHNALEYQSYEVYGLKISEKDFAKVETIRDLKDELYKQDLRFLRK
jgi:hypothetical protein